MPFWKTHKTGKSDSTENAVMLYDGEYNMLLSDNYSEEIAGSKNSKQKY